MSIDSQSTPPDRARTLVGFSVVLLLSPVMLFAPMDTAAQLATFIGLGLLIAAGSQFATTREMRSPRALTGWTWVVAGAILLRWPDLTLTAVTVVAGAALVVGGITQLRLMAQLSRRSDLPLARRTRRAVHRPAGADLRRDLDLLGVVALAPASDLAAITEANDGTTFGNVLGSYAITAWSRSFDDLDLGDLVDDSVLPVVEGLADRCISAGPDAVTLLTEAELLQLQFFLQPVWEVEPWATLIADNTPGAVTIDALLLVLQGTDDALILAELQRSFVTRLCERGQQFEYREIEGVGHLGVDDAADELVAGWLGDRLGGAPAASTCG